MDKRDRKPVPDETQTDLESPLGIAGTPVEPDAPENLRASNDPDEAKKRRRRAMADEHEPRRGMDDVNYDHKGATGIDLGADRGTK